MSSHRRLKRRAGDIMMRLFLACLLILTFPATGHAGPGDHHPDPSGEITPDGKCIDRTEQAAELNADPNLRNEICSLALAELSGPRPRDNEFADPELEKCYVMWFESVLNRTKALKERFGKWTVAKTISRESGYWPKKQIRPAVSANNAIGCQRALSKATQGSNTCGYCTDNGSAHVRQASIDRGDEGRDCIAANGKPERFAINKASGYDKWAAREKDRQAVTQPMLFSLFRQAVEAHQTASKQHLLELFHRSQIRPIYIFTCYLIRSKISG